MGNLIWTRQTMWIPELYIPSQCLWMHRHVVTQRSVFVCVVFQLEFFTHRQDISQILVHRDATGKSMNQQRNRD